MLSGHKILSASKSLLPTLLEYSNFSIFLSSLHSSPFTLGYIILDISSLPDIFPVLSFSQSFPCGCIYHYTHLKCPMTTSRAALLCCAVPTYPQSSLLCLMPTQFLSLGTGYLLSGGHPMLPQSCPFHGVSDQAWEPLPRLLRFTSLVADLQLPQCFRQVSCSAFIMVVLHAEVVQSGCYLNQLRISKITFCYSCRLGLTHHCVPMLCSSSLSSCHSLWSPGKLLSLDRLSSPLLHSVSASHHPKWEVGLNSLSFPQLLVSWSEQQQFALPGWWPARQKAQRDSSRAAQMIPCLVHHPDFNSVFYLLSRIFNSCPASLQPREIQL